MELDISFGKHRADTNWKIEYLEWGEFVDRLRKVRHTAETMVQYDKTDNIRRQKIKDGPAFVGGFVRGGRRKKENVETRSLITLDADHADDGFLFAAELVLGGTAYVVYSTHSHRPEKPKYRLIAPADRAMNPDEYAAVSRKLAEQIGMDYFDKTTFEVHRLMYLPSCSKDAKPILEVSEGNPVSVDSLLAEYEDWRDPLQWPRHAGDKAQRQTGKRMEDPKAKPGAVGAFCRCYSISEAIATFLPDIYTPVDNSLTRYTFAGASSYGGLVVYDEDTFAYSHHESDPCSGREVNAFDLVRLHKFGKLDEGISETTEIRQIPSFIAMKHYAETLDSIKRLRQAEGSAQLQAEFEDLIDLPEKEKGNKEFDLSKVQIPTGFKVIGEKIFEVKELKNEIKHIPVCDCMIAVTERYTNLTDGTHGLGITWKINESISTVFNARSTFMDSKKIINLSDYGLPVHSGNARALAGYLSRFESENGSALVTKLISNQLGWVEGGFLLGDSFIGEKDIQFHPKDGGDEQTAKGFHTRGTLEGTYQILRQIREYAPVKMAIYAALSAPLLSMWKENSFIFELAGGTSKGKTTALRIAASLFGSPDEQKPGFFKQWNLTKVYIERYAATMNNLPLFIDDTKKVTDPRIIPAIIYQFCGGQSRGRGSLKGSQAGTTWSTVMLSTGEQTLASFSKDGGAVGRILSLYGSPFLSADLETGKMIDELNKRVSENYGHIAEPWIRYLMKTDIRAWKKKITAINDDYRQLAVSHGEVAMRLSRLMAIVDVTGQMFDDCFSLQFYEAEGLKQEWIKLLTGATEIDRALEALEDVMGWVSAHHRQFIKGDDNTHGGPILSGRVKENEITIIGEQLDSYLQSKGYEPTSIAKAWKEKKWLNTEDGRTKKKVRLAGGLTRVYSFNLEKIGWTYDFERDYAEFGDEEFPV